MNARVVLLSPEGEGRFSRGGPCAASALPASGSRCSRVALSEDTQRVVPASQVPASLRQERLESLCHPGSRPARTGAVCWRPAKPWPGGSSSPTVPHPDPALSQRRDSHKASTGPSAGRSEDQVTKSRDRVGHGSLLRDTEDRDASLSSEHPMAATAGRAVAMTTAAPPERMKDGRLFNQSRRGTSGCVPRLSRALSLSDRLLPWAPRPRWLRSRSTSQAAPRVSV